MNQRLADRAQRRREAAQRGAETRRRNRQALACEPVALKREVVR
jgi:hypothetical protein